MSNKNRNKIMVMPVGEYVANKSHKTFNTTYRIRNGELVAIGGEGEMSLADLDKLYPTPHQLFYLENCDKRNNYLSNRKSF